MEQGERRPQPAVSETRDVTVNLPPGLVGDPQAPPRCPRALFDEEGCPAFTQIGLMTSRSWRAYCSFPIYDLVPPPGLPAQFGFDLLGTNTFLDAKVRSGGNYGITVNVEHIAQREVVNNRTIIWGVPADPSHNPERCADSEGTIHCGLSAAGGNELPFLTMPSQCSTPLSFSMETDEWLEPGKTSPKETPYSNNSGEPVGDLSGCVGLSLHPTVEIAPDTTVTDTPAGLGVDIKVPQEGLLDHESVAPADLKNAKVVLPAGVVINPGQAVGLGACQPSQDGLQRLPDGEEDDGPADCPSSAQVGTDEIESPLLAKPIKGSVYVMQSNPPNLELLMTAYGEGVFLKLLGHVELNEATGQLITTFDETPALPFTTFKLTFCGGAQAALVTPTQCGTYSTFSDFTPWSSPFDRRCVPARTASDRTGTVAARVPAIHCRSPPN